VDAAGQDVESAGDDVVAAGRAETETRGFCLG
jgi:hypothetical protein